VFDDDRANVVLIVYYLVFSAKKRVGKGRVGGNGNGTSLVSGHFIFETLDDVMNVLVDEYSVPKSIDEEKAEKNCGGLNDRCGTDFREVISQGRLHCTIHANAISRHHGRDVRD
jgi:hypothetical protein